MVPRLFLAALLLAATPSVKANAQALVYPTNPCTDGRYSTGQAWACRSGYDPYLGGWVLHGPGRPLPPPRPFYNPCTDGRFSNGVAHECRAYFDPYTGRTIVERSPGWGPYWK